MKDLDKRRELLEGMEGSVLDTYDAEPVRVAPINGACKIKGAGKREAWVIHRGRRVQAKYLEYFRRTGRVVGKGQALVMLCGNLGCINHEHARVMTHMEANSLGVRQSYRKNPALRKESSLRIKKAELGRKLTDEQLMVIRTTGSESTMRLAKEFGVHATTITRVRRGETHKGRGFNRSDNTANTAIQFGRNTYERKYI